MPAAQTGQGACTGPMQQLASRQDIHWAPRGRESRRLACRGPDHIPCGSGQLAAALSPFPWHVQRPNGLQADGRLRGRHTHMKIDIALIKLRG